VFPVRYGDNIYIFIYIYIYISKAIPITGRGGLMVLRRRGSHNRLIGSDEAVSLTRLPPFTLQEDSWYLFLLEDVPTTST
jgi:hypothetical protein